MKHVTEAALKILATGLTPHPLSGKKPILDEWQKLKNVSPEQVKAWDDKFGNVGIVCGETSHNLVVIDFDGLSAYEMFCKRFPSLVETLTVATGSGDGMHVYIQVDKLPENRAFKNIYGAPPDDPGAWVNIEFKSEGGQVVAPPSIHPDTHKPYIVAKSIKILHLPDLEEAVRWAMGFKENENWTPPIIRIGSHDPLNPDVLAALRAHFEGQKHTLHRDWINCSCPKSQNHKNGDKHFTFGYHPEHGIGNCFSCGTILTKELCELTGINYEGLGGLFINTRPQKKTDYHPAETKLAQPTNAPLAVGYISDKEALAQYIDEINGDAVPALMPMVNPYPFLHRFGGCAELVIPGQLVYFASISGGTKTISFETGWTELQKRGEHSIVYSPEHVDKRGAAIMTARAVQRAGGLSVADKMSQSLWQLAHANRLAGIMGKPIESRTVSANIAIAGRLQQLPGRLFYMTNPGISAERLCAEIETIYDLEAAKGNITRAVWIDFAQLLWLENDDTGRLWIESAINLIKDTCQRKNLVGWVSSQMRKDDAESAKNNGRFDSGMMQWLSEQQCNLLLMFTPKWENGERVDNILRAKILKNSMAALPDEEFDIRVDFNHLSWEV
jgi:hypothetical protein